MTLLLLAGCEDLVIPGSTLRTVDLLILRIQSTAPAPPSMTFYVVNSRQTVRTLRHNDGFNTLYVEASFPSNSIAAVDGAPLGGQDSVLVTLTAEPGTYGVTVSPEGLQFSSARPTIRFSYARYGDLSVASGSARYPDQQSYAAALEVWEEAGLDRWSSRGGSGSIGTDIGTSMTAGGRYIVAAPR